jgi:electron transfer flavoprotein alpha subunit
MSNVLVVAEHIDKSLRKVTLSAVAFAKKAAECSGGKVYVLVLGDDVPNVVSDCTKSGADIVLYENSPVFGHYLAENYSPVVAQIAESIGAQLVCGPSSTFGKDLLPRVAAHLRAGMVSDAIDVWEDGGLRFKRPLWAGNVLTTVEVTTPFKVVSVRTTEFDAIESDVACEVQVLDGDTQANDSSEFVRFDQVASERPELTDADIIISGGRGLKSAENFDMIMALADVLGGAVGASRAAVDSGYAPNDWQIGQTGKVVAPNLYVAVAISGAIQHLAGMKGSKVIVAVNKDPEAPIFQVADYGLVADAFEVIPEITDKLQA